MCAAIQSLRDLRTPPSVCVPLGKHLPVFELTLLICSYSLVLVFAQGMGGNHEQSLAGTQEQ